MKTLIQISKTEALSKAVKEFNPYDFNLSAICHDGEHQEMDYQVGLGEAWIDYSATIEVRDCGDCWEFLNVEITNLMFNDADVSFTEQELKQAIINSKYNR